MICTRCDLDGASMQFVGRWWFHPRCWLVVRTALLTPEQISDWAAKGRRLIDDTCGKMSEIGPTQLVTAEPTLTTTTRDGGASAMAIPHVTTGDQPDGC